MIRVRPFAFPAVLGEHTRVAVTHDLVARDLFERDDVGYHDPAEASARRIPIPNHLPEDTVYLKAQHRVVPGTVGRFEEVGRKGE